MAIDVAKFGDVLLSIDKRLETQTNFMEVMFEMEFESMEREKRREAFEGLKEEEQRDTVRDQETEIQKERKKIQEDFDEQRMGMFAGLAGGLGGLVGQFAKSGMKLLGPGILLALKEPITDFLGGFITEGLNQLDPSSMILSQEMKDALAGPLKSTAFWGSVGAVIGGKMGLGVALGGIMYDSLHDYVANNDNKISKFIEDEINIPMAAAATGILGPILATAVIGGLKNFITTHGSAIVSGSIPVAKFFGKMGIGGALLMFADDIGEQLELWTGSEGAGKAAELTAQAVGAGMMLSMFGPTGFIIGAVTTLALAAGGALLDFLHKREDKFTDDFIKSIESDMDEAQRLTKEGKKEEAIALLRKKQHENTVRAQREEQRAGEKSKARAKKLRESETVIREVSDALEKDMTPREKIETNLRNYEALAPADETKEGLVDYIKKQTALLRSMDKTSDLKSLIMDVPMPGNVSPSELGEAHREILSDSELFEADKTKQQIDRVQSSPDVKPVTDSFEPFDIDAQTKAYVDAQATLKPVHKSKGMDALDSVQGTGSGGVGGNNYIKGGDTYNQGGSTTNNTSTVINNITPSWNLDKIAPF